MVNKKKTTGKTKADKPVSAGGKEYHIETRPHDVAAHCILVGSPERATMIAEQLFEDACKVGDHRGLRSYTGVYCGMPMSVITTGMGCPSTGIVIVEAVRCGARRIIRVGSCSTLQYKPKLGESAIACAAVRLDGTTKNWVPIEYPAYANHRVVTALEDAAIELKLPHFIGVEATTDDFNEGQGRPDDSGYLPSRLKEQHEELTHRRVLLYSMESSAIFVWCSTHGHIYDPENGIWAGSVNAIYGNRQTNDFCVLGDENAARIALRAMLILNERYPLKTARKRTKNRRKK